MKNIPLRPETRQLLARIRAEEDLLNLDDLDFPSAERAIYQLARPVLDKIKLTRLQLNQYRWFLRELTSQLLARTGWDLAFELELLLRKWTMFGLEPDILQTLLCHCYLVLTRANPVSQTAPPGMPDAHHCGGADER